MASTSVTFACPDCGESFVVGESARATLLHIGCFACGTGVSDDAFRP